MSRGIMAQPRSFVGGHVLATLVGLGMRGLSLWLGGPREVWAAAAVAVALSVMALTRTIHSPAGANPLVVFAEGADWHFLLSPLLPGLALLFGVAAVANNLPGPWGVPPWPRFFWSRFMPRGVRGRLARLHRRRP
jgi:CBS-domain-containing membrane protein